MKNSTMGRVGTLALMLVASLALALPALASVRLEANSGLRGVTAGSASAQVRPDDRSGFRGTDLVTFAPTVANLDPDDSFDWTAAGAGAGGATALMLVLAGAALILRRNYGRESAPA